MEFTSSPSLVKFKHRNAVLTNRQQLEFKEIAPALLSRPVRLLSILRPIVSPELRDLFPGQAGLGEARRGGACGNTDFFLKGKKLGSTQNGFRPEPEDEEAFASFYLVTSG
ncbi:hypothetical protein P7K49_004796 [Saguinus oedipus]|uniref:Uncharacterized protein n=1 Tax=Saguinus oedipus TaxID=9490 RepID=A0ABQ9WA31_SAGOE|nr:hypothetical protein P7K49_004796 [Saguinus oedipus]